MKTTVKSMVRYSSDLTVAGVPVLQARASPLQIDERDAARTAGAKHRASWCQLRPAGRAVDVGDIRTYQDGGSSMGGPDQSKTSPLPQPLAPAAGSKFSNSQPAPVCRQFLNSQSTTNLDKTTKTAKVRINVAITLAFHLLTSTSQMGKRCHIFFEAESGSGTRATSTNRMSTQFLGTRPTKGKCEHE